MEEYSDAVHSYVPHYGPMPEGIEEARVVGAKAVVGAGGPDLPRYTCGGVGGLV